MGDRTFHFISGLPRSGSTLLAAILRQNPRIHAGMSSGLGALVSGVMQQMSPGTELSDIVSESQRRNILKRLFSSYYDGETDCQIILDTNRIWTTRMPLLSELYPNSKVIACVRNLSWVIDSLERQVRNNPFHFSRIFSPKAQGTVYSRAEYLIAHDALVGKAFHGLKEAFYGEQSASLLIVEYELLARAPEKVIPLVYEFIGEPGFEHDFDNVEYDAPEFDQSLGLNGLHRVRPKVEFQARRTILPPDLFNRFENMEFWRDLAATNANVIAQKPARD